MKGLSVRLPLLVALASVLGFNLAQAQLADFTIAGRDVVMHGFLAAGYMKSDGNNFLTAQTGAAHSRMSKARCATRASVEYCDEPHGQSARWRAGICP